MAQRPNFFGLSGGLNLITPAVQMPPGFAIAALNYEPVAQGYRRLRGFQRTDNLDGTKRVHLDEISISRINFTSGNTNLDAIVPGDKIGTNVISGTNYAVVVADPVISSGTTAGSDAAGYILVVIAKNIGSFLFENGSSLNSFPSSICTQSGDIDNDPDLTGYDENSLITIARDVIRDDVQPASGKSAVRAIFVLNGELHAVRDNSAGTYGIVYRAEGAESFIGWAGINSSGNGNGIVYFDQGGLDGVGLAEGDVVDTQSGAGTTNSDTINRIIITSGSFDDGDAAGYLVLSGVGGASWVNGAYLYSTTVSDTLRRARLTGSVTSFRLPVGGTYRSVTHNFYGASNLKRTYAVNGVGPAFEVDDGGTFLTPIYTGMTVDTPSHIAEHKNALFLGFAGGSIQFSSVGNPFSYSVIVGAGEFGIGDDHAEFIDVANGLGILGKNSLHALYGNDSSDYQLDTVTREAGALEFSAQRFGDVIYMDNRGLRTMASSRNYGNFSFGTISRMIEPLIKDKRRDNILPVASLLVRAADQYWLFFDDGTGLIVYLGAKNPSIMPFDLGFTVSCTHVAEVDGQERIFIGGTNGYVYELNRGTSFDGEPIEHYFRLAFNHFGSPQLLKRIHKVSIDLEASGTTTLAASIDYDYGSVAGLDSASFSVTTGGGAIDDLGDNELYFASQIETTAEVYVDGVAKNFSLKIGGSTSDEEPHTITGVTWHTTDRGMKL